ncbi:MAG: type II secretion system F family protein [Phycisphaerae bacterium]|nr:type II secretion system F family protein [Phycisphaerae bacterium]
MPSFVYQAADPSGKVSDGHIDGATEADAARALERQALTPLTMRPAKSERDVARVGSDGTTRIRLRLRELLGFTRQLRVMLASGITVLSTIALLRQRAKGNYQHLLDRLAADIQRGKTLSEALAAHPRTFDPFYVGTIRAGEAAGVHTEALTELIAYYERRATLRREIIDALTYPAIVVLALIGACIVMLIWVVPQFESVFASGGTALPWPTRILLSTSGVVTGHGWELAGAALALAIATWLLSPLPRVRAGLGHLANRLPIFGQIFHLATVVQFSRMIALLQRAGLPLLETFKVVTEMIMTGPVKKLSSNVRRELATGKTITEAVTGTQILPDLVEQMIAVGEQTGRLEETLAAAADHFEEELRVKIRRMTTALEPMLTMMVSMLVLFVALAIFLPMWEVNSLMLK